jgi:hypothetical protein
MGYVGQAPIADDAVNSAQIAAGAIDAAHMSVNSIDSDSYVDDSIDAAHYAAGSVDTTALGADSVTAAKIDDDAVTIAKLAATGTASSSTFLRGDNSWQAAGGTDASALVSGTLPIARIANDAIDSIHYAAASIDNEHLADDAVGVAELSATGTASGATFLRGDNVWEAVGKYFILTAPTLSSPANAGTSEDVVYTITSTDANDTKLILDMGSSNFTYQSVSVGTASKVGNTVECIGFTTNNPAVTIQFTAEATYSVTAKATNIIGSYGDSVSSSADSISISDFDPTSPYDYGNGADGAVTALTVVDTYLTNSSISAGTNTCTVNSATGFAAGEQVLIIQVQKGSFTTGVYEMLLISEIAGSTITFGSNFQYAYTSNSAVVTTQMVRIPNYSSVTLTSGTFEVPAWDGNEGGIFIAKCSGIFSSTQLINATGKGFRGGTSTSTGSNNPSDQGEGQSSEGSNSGSANDAGGGGGRMNVPGTLSAQGGAGGGHAAQGTAGTSNAVGGGSWGGQDLVYPSHLGFGGGGGAGGYDYASVGGHGGAGGGIIMIMAATVTLSGASGELAASGGGGTGNNNNNQGGGAGGSIYVKTGTFTTNDKCNAAAGPSGSSAGGAGSVGRIHVQVTTLTGTTSPTAYTG